MRNIRILLAALSLAAMVTVFVVPGVFLTWWLGWIARAQLVPAIMAGSVAVLVLLVILVVVFGRFYCSTICPLGISQDLVRGVFRLCRVPAFRLRDTKILRTVRLACLIGFVFLPLFGLTAVFEPYGIFGRFLSIGVLHFGESAVLMTIWSLALFIVIVGVGAVFPRAWCNTICPVGTFFGLFSRFAIFRVRIDASKCVKCGYCAKVCETGALQQKEDRTIAIDHSRCVACGNCRPACLAGALTGF